MKLTSLSSLPMSPARLGAIVGSLVCSPGTDLVQASQPSQHKAHTYRANGTGFGGVGVYELFTTHSFTIDN